MAAPPKRNASRGVGEKTANFGLQRRQVVLDDFLNRFAIDLKIGMDQNVPHADDGVPGNLGSRAMRVTIGRLLPRESGGDERSKSAPVRRDPSQGQCFRSTRARTLGRSPAGSSRRRNSHAAPAGPSTARPGRAGCGRARARPENRRRSRNWASPRRRRRYPSTVRQQLPPCVSTLSPRRARPQLLEVHGLTASTSCGDSLSSLWTICPSCRAAANVRPQAAPPTGRGTA